MLVFISAFQDTVTAFLLLGQLVLLLVFGCKMCKIRMTLIGTIARMCVGVDVGGLSIFCGIWKLGYEMICVLNNCFLSYK